MRAWGKVKHKDEGCGMGELMPHLSNSNWFNKAEHTC